MQATHPCSAAAACNNQLHDTANNQPTNTNSRSRNHCHHGNPRSRHDYNDHRVIGAHHNRDDRISAPDPDSSSVHRPLGDHDDNIDDDNTDDRTR